MEINMDDLRFTAIHIGEYNKEKVRDVLSYIEENYPDIRWVGREKPTEFIPEANDPDESRYIYEDEEDYEDAYDEYHDFTLFIDYDNEIFYDGLGYEDESEYEIIEAEDFMSVETLEDIQTDISFLFN